MPWQPLLDGAWNVSAWESVRAILADLESQGREPSGDPSLAGGTTGLAILQGYLAQAGGGSASVAVARRCLEYATASMAEQPENPGSHHRQTGWRAINRDRRSGQPGRIDQPSGASVIAGLSAKREPARGVEFSDAGQPDQLAAFRAGVCHPEIAFE